MPKRPTHLREIHPYPLRWPEEQSRTPHHHRERHKKWDKAFQLALEDLELECTRAEIHDWLLSTDRAYGRQGNATEDSGAALWFMQKIPVPGSAPEWVLSCIAGDKFDLLAHNIKAIALTIQRLRLIDSYGCYTFDHAVKGAAYAALPPPGGEVRRRPYWEVLGIAEDSPLEVAEIVYKGLAKKHHPDTGGSNEAFQELTQAWEEAKETLKK